jgi:hypothetical protein
MSEVEQIEVGETLPDDDDDDEGPCKMVKTVSYTLSTLKSTRKRRIIIIIIINNNKFVRTV